MGRTGNTGESERAGGETPDRGSELQSPRLTIVKPAVLINWNGEFFEGYKHDELHEWLYLSRGGTRPKTTDGFVTSLGYFVDRKRAAEIAIEAGQIKSVINPKLGLTSSELYGKVQSHE